MTNQQKPNKTHFFEIHSQTVKHLRLGHPWITKDEYTNKFPDKPGLIATSSKDRKSSWIFIGDPNHKSIKARFWGDYSNAEFKMNNFWNEFEGRLLESINFRKELSLDAERQNYYLTFGEADRLPGLFIMKLNEVILIQSYCSFWEYHSKILFNIVKKNLSETYPMSHLKYFLQSRNNNKKTILQELK